MSNDTILCDRCHERESEVHHATIDASQGTAITMHLCHHCAELAGVAPEEGQREAIQHLARSRPQPGAGLTPEQAADVARVLPFLASVLKKQLPQDPT